jgi:uncharacterized protein YkwD
MKANSITKMAAALGLTAVLVFSPTTAATASADADSPKVERTKAWDGINHTLGGVPESVRKIEYRGSVFYLAPDISDADFTAVLAAGPEAVRLKPPRDSGGLYRYPVYILWDSGKTTLLVHPIIFDYDDIPDAVAIPSDPPASLAEAQTANEPKRTALTGQDAIDCMLSTEYADDVRMEFYRLLNAYRAENGLRELEVNLELQGYADLRAGEQRTRFGHTRPGGTTAGSGWHNSRNNLNSRYAENALKTGAISPDPADTALGIFSIWKNSDGHNRHMLYDFGPRIAMGFGIDPKLDDDGLVTSGAIFATGY